MNQKIIFCIAFLVIICCDAGVSSAAVENNVGDFDDINKTLTIYDNESKVMTVRLISAVPDIGTFTEIFEVSNFEAYTPDSKLDFTARTDTKVGIGDVIRIEWFIEQNVSYIVNVTDYGIKQVEEIIYNNKTGKNETILVNRTVITGYHDETRYKDVWGDYQPYDKVMSDQVQRIKVVYHKVPELGPFRIQTVPVFRGVECPELTWWSGSWDRRRAILINNTGGDSVTDYQLMSVNLSSYNINASSARIINSTSGSQESFWNETVDTSGNLEYVWCKFSNLSSGRWINSTYEIYYQSTPTASSSSSGTDTFLQWHGFASANFIDSLIVNPTDPIVYEAKARITTYATNKLYIGISNNQVPWTDDSLWIDGGPAGDLTRFISYNDNVATTESESPKPVLNTWYKFKIIKQSGTASGYKDDNLIGAAITNNLPDESLGLFFYEYSTTQGEQEWSFVRKYIVNKPELWIVGVEEEYVAPTPTPTPALTTLVSSAQYDELNLPLILYILMISMLYLFIAFRHGVAAVELSLIYLIFAFFFLLFQTVTISVNYIYLTLFLLLFMISIAGITLEKRSW